MNARSLAAAVYVLLEAGRLDAARRYLADLVRLLADDRERAA